MAQSIFGGREDLSDAAGKEQPLIAHIRIRVVCSDDFGPFPPEFFEPHPSLLQPLFVGAKVTDMLHSSGELTVGGPNRRYCVDAQKKENSVKQSRTVKMGVKRWQGRDEVRDQQLARVCGGRAMAMRQLEIRRQSFALKTENEQVE